MSRKGKIPLAFLREPEEAMRGPSLYEGLADLRASLNAHGLLQNIGVIEHSPVDYEVIWGHRRSIAATELGWSEIDACIYQPGEGDKNVLMLQENLQRQECTPMEEAVKFARQRDRDNLTIGAIATLNNLSETTVRNRLALLDMPDEVRKALEDDLINEAQARELSKYQDEAGRHAMLISTIQYAIPAQHIKLKREQRDADGTTTANLSIAPFISQLPPDVIISSQKCHFADHYVQTGTAHPVWICQQCEPRFLEARDLLLCHWVLHGEAATLALVDEVRRLVDEQEQQREEGQQNGNENGQAATT